MCSCRIGLSLVVFVAFGAEAASLGTVTLTPSFETAGVIVQTSGDDGNETVQVEIQGPNDSGFKAAHPSTRFEPHGFATSLFELTADTTYALRITLIDPDGVSGAPRQTLSLHTRAEPVTPVPTRVRWVGPQGQDTASAGADRSTPYATPSYALLHAQAGDQIRVLAGSYPPVSVSGLHGTSSAPISLVADDGAHRPLISGDQTGANAALQLNDTSNVIIDGMEIRYGGDDDGGIGLYLRASSHDTIRHCYIHDNGHYDVLVSKSDQYSGGVLLGGYHLLEDNEIADVEQVTCTIDNSHDECPTITYYGIKQDNNPGAGTVIRRNFVHGHSDNTSPCGDENLGRELADGQPVLALIGNGGTWTNHDLEFYDNNFVNARDDGMEMDGICVNARIWRNTINGAQNAFSAAPALPGPYFFVRNVATGPILEAGFKINTAGESNVASRHIFVYHNTFVWSQPATLLNLWFAVEGDHNVPIHDLVYRNNVFSTPLGGTCIDSYNHGLEEPSFDGDVWYSPSTSGLFSWWNGTSTVSYDQFADFQRGTGQDAHGAFGLPGLGSDFVPTHSASLVIDRAVAIPGINDHYVGNAPDVGAYELGSMPGADPGAPDGGSALSPDGGTLEATGSCGCSPSSNTGSGSVFSFLVAAAVAAALQRGRLRRSGG